jgi:hypothetical protein
MAHYAFLDENNIVTEVITGIDETELIEGLDPETWYGNFRNQVCKRTSYNTFRGQHKNGGIPFRGNYAGIDMIYIENLDIFIEQQTYPSWILNETTFEWEAPVPYPTIEEGSDEIYTWDENTTSWLLLPPSN